MDNDMTAAQPWFLDKGVILWEKLTSLFAEPHRASGKKARRRERADDGCRYYQGGMQMRGCREHVRNAAQQHPGIQDMPSRGGAFGD